MNMFDRFTAQKRKRRGARILAIGSALLHLILGAGLVLMGFWEISEIGRPSRGVAMATTMIAPSGGAEAPAGKKVERTKKIVRETRQPSSRAEPDAKTGGGDSGATTGNGTGDPGPTGNGPPGSSIVGELCLDPERCAQGMPSIPKPLQSTPEVKNLPPTVLSELRRVAGDPQIQPPTSTQNAMAQKHEKRTVAVVQMCLNRQGQVNRQSIVKSSGYPEYDGKLLSKIRKWKYQPYRADGAAIAICTHVTFIYQQ